MDSIIDFKSVGLMHETKNFQKKETAPHSNELASFRRQAWSNTQWFPRYGGAPAFPRLVQYGGFH